MKIKDTIIGLIGVATVMTGCYNDDIDRSALDETTVPVKLSMAVAPTAFGLRTRMADEIVQVKENQYRGIEPMATCFVPFAIPASATTVTVKDSVQLNIVQNAQTDPELSRQPYYFWSGNDCQFKQGVNAFLVYAKAPRTSGGDAENGALEFTHDTRFRPKNTSFKPKQIQPTLTVPADAQKVADYLTSIANSSANGVSWRNINHVVLDTLYQFFINQKKDDGPKPMAGSAVNAVAHVKVLRKALQEANFSTSSGADAIKSAILANITAGLVADETTGELKLYATDYPATLGLPDGAAIVKWNNTTQQFEPLIQTTVLDNINNITRYVYPAELWYRANSRIRVSEKELEYVYDPGKYTWLEVMESHYGAVGGKVSHSVKAVAINDQLQYAVARLSLKLVDTARSLKDADDEYITVSEGAFPLTGIVVGCQRPVDFEFKPFTPDALDAYVRFVYDGKLTNSSGNPRLSLRAGEGESEDAVSTLVLQTLDEEDVPLLLEFQNKSGVAFKGINGGVIRPDTKFYLLGTITYDPTKKNAASDYTNRVFTQDYTTTVSVQVPSLAKAYNILPDLLSAKLDVGVQLVTKWEESSTSYVPLQ